jgi:demethoxyubiquinone hydroxylase (CLK1/Coq7/Cat5 family)
MTEPTKLSLLSGIIARDIARDGEMSSTMVRAGLVRDMIDHIERLEALNAELLQTLERFRDHVARHACVWDDASNGSHHNPIWLEIAELLSKANLPASDMGVDNG